MGYSGSRHAFDRHATTLTALRHLTRLRAGAALGDGGPTTVTARIEALIATGRRSRGPTATTDATPPPAA